MAGARGGLARADVAAAKREAQDGSNTETLSQERGVGECRRRDRRSPVGRRTSRPVIGRSPRPNRHPRYQLRGERRRRRVSYPPAPRLPLRRAGLGRRRTSASGSGVSRRCSLSPGLWADPVPGPLSTSDGRTSGHCTGRGRFRGRPRTGAVCPGRVRLGESRGLHHVDSSSGTRTRTGRDWRVLGPGYGVSVAACVGGRRSEALVSVVFQHRAWASRARGEPTRDLPLPLADVVARLGVQRRDLSARGASDRR